MNLSIATQPNIYRSMESNAQAQQTMIQLNCTGWIASGQVDDAWVVPNYFHHFGMAFSKMTSHPSELSFHHRPPHLTMYRNWIWISFPVALVLFWSELERLLVRKNQYVILAMTNVERNKKSPIWNSPSLEDVGGSVRAFLFPSLCFLTAWTKTSIIRLVLAGVFDAPLSHRILKNGCVHVAMTAGTHLSLSKSNKYEKCFSTAFTTVTNSTWHNCTSPRFCKSSKFSFIL